MLFIIGVENWLDDEDDDCVVGICVVYDWLEKKGININGMVIDNGVGLSCYGCIIVCQGV